MLTLFLLGSEDGKLSVQINEEGFQTLGTYELDSPDSYFKVGNYLQGSSASEVRFYSIDISHKDKGNSSSSSSNKRAHPRDTRIVF